MVFLVGCVRTSTTPTLVHGMLTLDCAPGLAGGLFCGPPARVGGVVSVAVLPVTRRRQWGEETAVWGCAWVCSWCIRRALEERKEVRMS